MAQQIQALASMLAGRQGGAGNGMGVGAFPQNKPILPMPNVTPPPQPIPPFAMMGGMGGFGPPPPQPPEPLHGPHHQMVADAHNRATALAGWLANNRSAPPIQPMWRGY